MRYVRDENPGDLDRARAEVRRWRERHPQGSAEEMLAGIGDGFSPDYGPVLRGILGGVDMRPAGRGDAR